MWRLRYVVEWNFFENWSTFTITFEVYLRRAEKMGVSGIQSVFFCFGNPWDINIQTDPDGYKMRGYKRRLLNVRENIKTKRLPFKTHFVVKISRLL